MNRWLACVCTTLFLLAPAQLWADAPLNAHQNISYARSSCYRDGYQIGGSGTVYTLYYDYSLGAYQDLRQDALGTQAILAKGYPLAGYNENTGSWQFYYGNGSNLTAHQANYGWNPSYHIAYDGNTVTVDVQLAFDWSLLNPTAQQIDQDKGLWESWIEDVWNNRYGISINGTSRIGIAVDVNFDGYEIGPDSRLFDQEVVVAPGSGRGNMCLWYENQDKTFYAHEFGHMLGLYDEYWGGGIDPVTLETGTGTLMSDATSWLKPSYYNDFANWLDSMDPDPANTYAVVAVPEPASALVLVCGLVGLLRRKRT